MSKLTIEERFEIHAPARRVLEFLSDPEQFIPCLPGAAYGKTHDDGKFDGTITVAVGPVTLKYAGWARFTELDKVGGRLVLEGRGRESTGSGFVKMVMTCTVAEIDGVTSCEVSAEVKLAGKIVGFGRGIIKTVNRTIFLEFTQRARTHLEVAESSASEKVDAPASEPKALSVLPLLLKALWTALVDFFRRLFKSGS
jgi:carbon monoxide dehydrogenase subunit G